MTLRCIALRRLLPGCLALGACGLATAAAAQLPGDANCDGEITAADPPALTAALFGGNACAGADANEDAVVSAADAPALLRRLLPGAPPTPTREDGSTPTPTASPLPTGGVACPADGATLHVTVANRTGTSALAATIRGRLVAETCAPSGALAETYELSVGDAPATVPLLAPGVWVHSITVDDPPLGQQQHDRSLLLAGTAPNEIAFTAFASVFTVRTAADAMQSDSLRDALAWAQSATPPALIQFDDATFPPGTPTVVTLTDALPKLSGDDVTIDGIDADGRAGQRVIDADGRDVAALAVTGGSNRIVGLRLRNTGAHNRDVVSISGAGAAGNLVERCIVEHSGTGDGIGIDDNAGSDFESTVNVVRDTEVSGASDKGIKVTTNAFALLQNNWVHDNLNGGIQATLSGHVYAIDNVVEHNGGGGTAQNGFAANGGVAGSPVIASELRTDGNIARFNVANGIAILGLSVGLLRNDYLAANGSSGIRIFNRGMVAPLATVEGITAACNAFDGAVVTDDALADFGGPMSPGNNAFTQNNLPANANFRNGTGARVYTLNNQWEHCGRDAQCVDADIAAYDLSDHGVHSLFSPAQAHRSQRTPIVTRSRPAKATAGELVRIFGFGFNAVDGHAAGSDCPDVATRNRCMPLRGNCVLIDGVPAPIEALTPTMLVVRMPFSCVAPVPLTVETQGGGSSTALTFCTND